MSFRKFKTTGGRVKHLLKDFGILKTYERASSCLSGHRKTLFESCAGSRHRHRRRWGLTISAEFSQGSKSSGEGPLYDPAENAAYWALRPAAVANRLVEIATVFGQWRTAAWFESRRQGAAPKPADDGLPRAAAPGAHGARAGVCQDRAGGRLSPGPAAAGLPQGAGEAPRPHP
eukprot:CAMPEP_0177578666 /NCGR_PEP_ID=MMETSP0419_2-20121207/478_1 /TAXON_ID=582737 /ORGANISM="Tetraselmis sp., Strain GSL018" /LENGTH=173 /DNA_ID=CAMNT_0019067141 /DNA_START=206 /DNA_END=724 /DNA_ORIENTATION=+